MGDGDAQAAVKNGVLPTTRNVDYVTGELREKHHARDSAAAAAAAAAANTR